MSYRNYSWATAQSRVDRLPMVEGPATRSLAEFERACLVHLREEQEKPNPDNALISVLCDGVRLAREFTEHWAAEAERKAGGA